MHTNADHTWCRLRSKEMLTKCEDAGLNHNYVKLTVAHTILCKNFVSISPSCDGELKCCQYPL